MGVLKEKKNGQFKTTEAAVKFLQEQEAENKKKFLAELKILCDKYGYEPLVRLNYQSLSQKLVRIIDAEQKVLDFIPKK